MYSVAD